MNTFTTTNKHTLWVEDKENNPIRVDFHLVERWGAEQEMVLATVQHFAFACAVMAGDMVWQPEHKKFQEYSHRLLWNSDPVHEEPRVQIFTNHFPIWQNGAIVYYSLNVMTENTSALEVVEGMSLMLDAASEVEEICNRLKPETPPQSRQSAPNSPGTASATTHTANGESVQLPNGVILENGAPLIESWSYKLQEDYERLFAGGKVNVRIGKVDRMLVDNRDQSEQFDVVRFYPLYNGQVEDKDRRCLRLYVTQKDGGETYDWKTFKKDWLPYFENYGDKIAMEGTATFKLNESNGKVYWNFYGLRFDEDFQTVEHEGDTYTNIPAHATIEDRPDDIPF
jgi:hypothetical protein